MISFHEHITSASHRIGYHAPQWLSQTLKFSAVGVLNTSVDWLAYFLLTHTIDYFGVNSILAKGLSYTLGIVTSYLLNRKWTFHSQQSVTKSLTFFTIINLLAILLNSGAYQIALQEFHLAEGYALLLATFVTFLWNFLWSKLFIFKK